MHSLLIRIEWTTGNGILVSSSHWPIYNKFPPGSEIAEEAGSLPGDCGEAGARPQLRPEVRLICGVVIIIIPRNYEKTEEIYWFIYEVP